MTYYAVGLKGWVEVRRCRVPPKPKTSYITITRTRTKIIPGVYEMPTVDRPYGRFEPSRVEHIPYKAKVGSTVVLGGRVIKTFRARRFRDLIGVSVKDGAFVALIPDQVDKLLKES